MKLSKPTIQELGIILNEEFNLHMSASDLEKFAYGLVGYFTLLLKAETRNQSREGFGNSPASLIDNKFQKHDNTENKK